MLRNYIKQIIYSLFAIIIFSSCHQEENIDVEIDVVLHTKDNHTSPLVVTIENNTKNAEEFLWAFEGGEPASSTKRNPGTVTFTTPGEHIVTLEAWNLSGRVSKNYTVNVDSIVTIDFDIEEEINNYAPARFSITNLSTGGSAYKWLCEGGEPATYEGKNPPVITYPNEGKYTIVLVVDNGTALFTKSKDIDVRETLDASFSIIPSYEDIDDMEAPLRATFNTQFQGVESLSWECAGAAITNPQSKDAKILFPTAGVYTVYLEVSNGKEVKRVSQEITVKENTNLRTHQNIKLGINTAQETIGSFYSTKLRQVIKSSQANESNGSVIDIAFFGLNEDFIYSHFVSPDNLGETALRDIPNAQATKFINKQENGSIKLSVQDFGSMSTDYLLKALPIGTADCGDEYFTDSLLPRVVLFETSDGRRGAILIKEIVKGGKEGSYILVDVKVQKND